MRAATRLALALALATGLGCVKQDWIDRTLVTESVTGVWEGSMASSGGQPSIREDIRLALEQKGPNVTGLLRHQLIIAGPRGTTPIEGSMAGDQFTFRDVRGRSLG